MIIIMLWLMAMVHSDIITMMTMSMKRKKCNSRLQCMNGTTVLTESNTKKQANSWYNINVLIFETPDEDDADDYGDNNDNADLKKTAQTTAMYNPQDRSHYSKHLLKAAPLIARRCNSIRRCSVLPNKMMSPLLGP